MMDSKKIRKSISRFFGWIGLNTCSLIIGCIPERYIYAFAGHVAFLAYCLARKQRTIALESLTIAFGKEKSASQIEQIARDCFAFMAKSGIEMLYLMDKPRLILKRVSIAGKQHLDNALARGCGVILVSAHFGNFPLMMAHLALSGYKIGGIMRRMRDERAEKMFALKRRRMGIKAIYSTPRDTCVNETLQALRNNELVFIPLDQNFGTGGVFVDFFGRKAATATGPVVLARRTKAALLPCFTIRQKDDTHKVIFEPPVDLEEAANPQQAVLINVQKLTGIIESYIRRYPAEWGWIHRRWKSKEGGV